MEFKEFSDRLRAHVASVLKDEANLFVVDVDKDILWNTYLDAFPPGTNEVYRKRREHDCSCCRHFFRDFGTVVAVRDNQIVTMWDFPMDDPKYGPVVAAMAALVRSRPIAEVFVSDMRGFGSGVTRDMDPASKVIEWHHFRVDLPTSFTTHARLEVPTVRGRLRDVRNVFERSLRELSADAVESVLELIGQKSLYKGEEWDAVLRQFLTLHREYHALPEEQRAAYCWRTAMRVGPVIGKIKNHSIGVLLANISEGMDLDEAVRKYEQIVAPTNYKRPKAIFTKRMVEDAQRTIEDLGLADALDRRYATLDDIRVPNILFANRDAQRRMGAGGVFDQLAAEVRGAKKFGKLEEVQIDDFVREILPKATGVELYLENAHVGNLVSLVAPKNGCDKTLFKWGNGFSWAYKGNITDSMKERVKAAGGKVDGVLRFSICWNEGGDNHNDFDAHCVEPGGNRIYFGNKRDHRSGGNLDVDIMLPTTVAVENITWPDRGRMPRGVYTFGVHNYAHRGGRTGFTAEIEFDGQLYSFAYDKEIRQKDFVTVAEVELLASGEFKITEKLPSNVTSRDAWGLKTNQFHPVSVAMFSPNYWDAQDGIGHRHYFFMLAGCVNDEAPNGFFNEFLREDLMAHKRVFEALGAKMRVTPAPDQLSGVGFSATKHAAFVCKVDGAFQRTLKVNI